MYLLPFLLLYGFILFFLISYSLFITENIFFLFFHCISLISFNRSNLYFPIINGQLLLSFSFTNELIDFFSTPKSIMVVQFFFVYFPNDSLFWLNSICKSITHLKIPLLHLIMVQHVKLSNHRMNELFYFR